MYATKYNEMPMWNHWIVYNWNKTENLIPYHKYFFHQYF